MGCCKTVTGRSSYFLLQYYFILKTNVFFFTFDIHIVMRQMLVMGLHSLELTGKRYMLSQRFGIMGMIAVWKLLMQALKSNYLQLC